MHYPFFLFFSISLSLIPFWQDQTDNVHSLSAIISLQYISTQLQFNAHQQSKNNNQVQSKVAIHSKNNMIVNCIHFGSSPKKLPFHQKRRVEYIRRFHKIAITERKKFGIPASITLAQGIVESQQGTSTLTQKYKNHFGIKCNTKAPACQCATYADDKPDDRFKIYTSDWMSYRDHSHFLQKKRYQKLFEIPISDYKSWANGLKETGYATDPNYAKKLIQIIEQLELFRFDQDTSKSI